MSAAKVPQARKGASQQTLNEVLTALDTDARRSLSEAAARKSLCRMRQTLRLCLLVGLTILLIDTIAPGQEASAPPGSSIPTTSATITPTGTPVITNPTPIPLAEVVTQAEATSISLRDIEASLASDQITITVAEQLPVLIREIDARSSENAEIFNSNPSLETLRSLATSWQKLGDNLPAWERSLTTRATQLGREIARLSVLNRTWGETLESAQSAETPPEIVQRIETIIRLIEQTRGRIERQRAQILTLQNRVAEQGTRVAEAIASVQQARNETVNRLLVKDSPPIWSQVVRSRTNQNLVGESQNSFSTQFTALNSYAERQKDRFFFHVVIIVLLVAALYWARQRVQPWVEEEPSLKRAALIFDVPIATAIVLSVLAGGWIYPQAPRLWQAILGAATLIPTIIILRRLVERHLFSILNALVIFYFLDLLRMIAASLPLVSRLLFLAEMFGGILFLTWLIKSARLSEVPGEERDRLWRTIGTAARIALAFFAVAFIASALGYVSLADLLGSAVLSSAYVAVILYAAVKIADGLIMFALRVRPLVLLRMVREHRPLFRRRVRRVLQWTAFLLWSLFTLEWFSLRAPVLERIRGVLSASLTVGSLNLSLGNVLAFIIVVWASFLVSRFLRFIMEEDIYPRFTLARGLPYAISTVLHYLILLLGFFAAVAALGFDMTRFTILAGAFSVGLGFGLQNIVNNFVSGLIVLFERPVKVGDVIQLEGAVGVVERIGIRATIIRTQESSEIIVPNGKLISDRVTNWTFSNRQRGMEIPVGVAYNTDPRRVIELLERVAAAHPLVIESPPPQALFTEFGADSLNFKLSAWTNDFEQWTQIRSDLAVAIYAIFTEENISIPVRQSDLHLRSIDPEALQALRGNGSGPPNDPISVVGQTGESNCG